MKSFFLDTNVLIYWAYANFPQHKEVDAFIGKAIEADCSLYVLSSTLNEVYYALRTRYMTEPDARTALIAIADVFALVDLNENLVTASLGSDEPDYEDGLVRATAEALQVDAIVSYDRRAFKKSFIPKLTARQALEELPASS